jgi:predicted N-acyltransferase
MLSARLGERVVLMLAEHSGKLVAGALNLAGSDTLYGRNWGCIGDFPFLHFELCYYRAIDFAIAHGMKTVEAGAQGEHKIQRGYLPSPTYSAHWIANPGLRRAIGDHLARERPAMEAEMATLMEFSPFKEEK